MFSLNRATIIGNLTRDPELRYTPSGQAVTNFSVATNRRYKNTQGVFVDDTEFHEIVAWQKAAETICQYCKKGNKVYIEGRLQTRNWDAPDGSKRYRTEIIAESVIFLTPKPAGTSSENYQPSVSQPTNNDISNITTEKVDDGKSKIDKPEPAEKDEDEEINLDDIPF